MKEDMRSSMRQAERFADDQLKIVDGKLEEAELNLKTFEADNRTISLDGEAKAIVEVRSELDRQIYLAESNKQEAEARIQALIQELSKTESTVNSAETLSQNPILLSLQEDLIRAEVRLDSLKKRYITTDNLEIKVMEGEVDNLKNKIAAETENILSSTTKSLNPIYQKLKQDIIIAQSDVIGYEVRTAVLEQQKNNYDDEIGKWPEKKIQLLKLQQELAMYQKIRDSLLETKQEAVMAQQAELGNVRIWDPAIEPQKPVSPRKKLNILLGVLIGLALGIGLAFLRDYFDNTYPSLEDAHRELESLGLPVSLLGLIPAMEATEEQRIGLMAHDARNRSPAEAFRIVRTKLQFMDTEKPPKILLVTSSTQGEGKTTIASNIAITFAQMEKKVILVDADLRRPALHKIYAGALAKPSNEAISSQESEITDETKSYKANTNPSYSLDMQGTNLPDTSDNIGIMITGDNIRKPGLSELLLMMNEKEPLEALKEVAKKTEVDNLYLLTSGTIPPNPSELLNSERMKEFVHLLEREYDYVIIDSPPVRAVADPVILSTLVDCVIYVADIVKTKKPDIRYGLETLSDANPHNIGIICNLIEPQYGGYYGYGRYGYSKYGYYGRYRYSSYYYYYYYYASDEEEEENKESRKKKKRKLLPGRNNSK
jgi:tyrosine-protein kinase Etk/Wzc